MPSRATPKRSINPNLEQSAGLWCASSPRIIGQILIEDLPGRGFGLRHRDDRGRDDLLTGHDPHEASRIAKFDDQGNYRPLKTAPNLRHGWQLKLANAPSVELALDLFYPGRLAILIAAKNHALTAIPLRTTLARQSGMYRVAVRLTDSEANALVGRFCRSSGGSPGCLRTILWKQDEYDTPASTELPPEKFDSSYDQTGRGETTIPLLCQEACNLLVAEAREVVKASDEPTNSTL